MSIDRLFTRALDARSALFDRLAAEGTDCVRLFHGATEGLPGVAIDRYGPVLLTQSWGVALDDEMRDAIVTTAHERVSAELVPAFVRRDAREGEDADARLVSPNIGSHARPASVRALDGHSRSQSVCASTPARIGHELGLAYDVRPYHRGKDPLLFLDLRVARRWVRANASNLRVLNLFAYTCGVGVAAAAGGAKEVWNVDFARSALEVGRANAERNGISEAVFRTIEENAIPILRQLAGMPVKGRGRERPYLRVDARSFELVVLDPPRWAKTPFGAIDVVRDYPSLIKPAMACTAPGGRLLLTNHVPTVSADDFERVVRRTAEKSGRELLALEALEPEADFPSPDAQPPLKILIATLGASAS